MKKMLCIFLLLLLLTGCGSIVNQMSGIVDLMPKASPETSALGLWVYDGEIITRQHLFGSEQVREEAIAPFRKAKAEAVAVDLTTLKPPFYGMEMGGTDGVSVYGLWSDGYFIMGDGSVYGFDYDFEALRQRYDFEEPDEFQFLSLMPCASHVAKSETGWNKAFLSEAAEPEIPDGITAKLTDQNVEAVTAEFTNESGEDWGYGYAYSVQVLLDGVWYVVPPEQDMVFVEVLLMVPAGGTSEETFSLKPYGDLPTGTYRVVSNGLTIEFSIE